MKRLSNLFAALVFASLVIFMSCGGGGDNPAPDPGANALLEQAKKLAANTWVVSSVSDPDGPTQKWNDFTLKFTANDDGKGGNYEVTGTPDGFDGKVWANGSSTWNFVGDNILKVKRANLTPELTISGISATEVTFTFNVPTQDGRTSAIQGDWTFKLKAQ